MVTEIQSISRDLPMSNNMYVIDQNDEKLSHANAVRRIVRKLDRRLLLFLVFLEISSAINLVSIGHSKLMGIQDDLHMTAIENDLAISLFYFAKILFVLPSNLFLRCIGSTRYMALSMFSWGSITLVMAFVKNPWQLLIVRFLLGVAEVGYFPCVVIYFSFWYCKRDQTMRIAILFAGGIVCRAFAGVLAYGMGKMVGIGGLKDWQWMFLIESSPTIPLSIITYLFLDSIPNAVQWLTSVEKQILTNFLWQDGGMADYNPTSSTQLSWRQFRYVFIDGRIYVYSLVTLGNFASFICLTTDLPTLLDNAGFSDTEVPLLTSIPYVVAFFCCLLASYSSYRRNDYSYHIVFCLSVGLLGFLLMFTLFDQGKMAVVVTLTVTFCGILSTFPLMLSWLTNNVGGHTKRPVAISFVFGIAQIGGVITPFIYRKDDKPIYRRGHAILCVMTAITLVLTIVLRLCLMRENNRRRNLSPEEYRREAEVNESCDRHPNVRYVL